jgi:hypothetical protein
MIGLGAVAAPVAVQAAIQPEPLPGRLMLRDVIPADARLKEWEGYTPPACQGPIQGWPEFMHGSQLPIRTAQNLTQEQVAYILSRQAMTRRRARWDKSVRVTDEVFDIESPAPQLAPGLYEYK